MILSHRQIKLLLFYIIIYYHIYVQVKPKEEVIDIDLTDPEVEKAAVKIQAGFKGYQARKSLNEKVWLGLARMSGLNTLFFYLSVDNFIFSARINFFHTVNFGLFWWEIFWTLQFVVC